MTTAWHFEELDGSIGLLTIDLPDKPVNTLGREVMSELAEHVRQLGDRDDLVGLLVRSGKPGQFVAGADLRELGLLVNAGDELIEEGLSSGHDVFSAIGKLPFPVVALVDGKCLGGGTELKPKDSMSTSKRSGSSISATAKVASTKPRLVLSNFSTRSPKLLCRI